MDEIGAAPRGAHLRSLKTANTTIRLRRKMGTWTPHDLRRTAASKMRSLGVDRRVVQGILNHKDWSITAVYDRYGMDPEKQEALDLWGRRVEEIVGDGAPGAVVSFPARSGTATARGRVVAWRRGDRG